jgi:CHAT domain-containing protein
MRTIVLGLLLSIVTPAFADEPKPPMLTPEGQKLADEATKLHDEAFQLYQQGKAADAIVKVRQALEIRQKLYPTAKFPDGHPDLAKSLNSIGLVLKALGQAEPALPYYRQSLEMHRKLYPAAKYPDGHPQLALGLNGMGAALLSMGQAEQALHYSRKGLEMAQKLFPASKFADGTPFIANSLNGMGCVLEAMGQAEQALPYSRQSFQMRQRLLRRELATASEEAAFDKIAGAPLFRDVYLSVTTRRPTPATDTYAEIWPSRAMVARRLEQRQANARAAGTDLGARLAELRGIRRRRIDQLLQDSHMNKDERDKQLTEYANQRDTLERELVEKIPALKRWQELDKVGPADLVNALPPGSVFIDLIRYTHFEYVDKKQKRTPHYVAFVVCGGPVARIELEKAEPIDAAVRQWRTAIDARRDAPRAVVESKRLVWDKLALAIPPGTRVLYLTADGDLARLPWAALPVGKERVLLEDYAIAQVPHGLWLLDHLKSPRSFDGNLLFALGGVEYGSADWPALPGTAKEAAAIVALATGERDAVSGTEANVAKVTGGMATARYVHQATHGEFKADALAAERKRAAAAMEAQLKGDTSRPVAAKNPLGYVGVVLSGGEALSGLGIVDLPLTNTQLVTLSTCETGLGEYTGGEGVQGLQRAFHLAGCPNVIASLWKVNDAATAALMTKFYHELWVTKREPLAALREAQLMIYHRPDLIPDLAGERGAPKFNDAVKAKLGEPGA